MELLWPGWISFALGLAMFAGCISLIRLKMARGRLRSTLKATGWLCILPISLATILLLLMQGCEEHSDPVRSPDGRRVARTLVHVGSALDANYATVIVRRSWSPTWKVAYDGVWFGELESSRLSHLRWIAPDQLEIAYPDDPSHVEDCKSQAGDVRVVCRPVQAER